MYWLRVILRLLAFVTLLQGFRKVLSVLAANKLPLMARVPASGFLVSHWSRNLSPPLHTQPHYHTHTHTHTEKEKVHTKRLFGTVPTLLRSFCQKKIQWGKQCKEIMIICKSFPARNVPAAFLLWRHISSNDKGFRPQFRPSPKTQLLEIVST